MSQAGTPALRGEIEIRVRYPECDPMGIAHHAAYLVWLEMGRTELLRQAARVNYRQLEEQGVFFAVVKLSVNYRRPARYDDVLALHTTISSVGRATIDHAYELHRDGELLATAATTIVCLDRAGRPRALPETLGLEPGPAETSPRRMRQ